MKILFLAQRVPYPPNRGDKITSWRLVERLSRAHEVTVIAFAHDEADRKAAQVLREEKGIETIAIDHDERSKKLRSMPLLLTGKPSPWVSTVLRNCSAKWISASGRPTSPTHSRRPWARSCCRTACPG
ncbi:MAG: hypothetical protein R3F17_12880 [Planctomycetota bacterium]